MNLKIIIIQVSKLKKSIDLWKNRGIPTNPGQHNIQEDNFFLTYAFIFHSPFSYQCK